MRVLVISNVWVEPTSSAAGSRMLQLLEIFQSMGAEITYATTANKSEYAFDLESVGVAVEKIAINDDSFDAFAKKTQPSIVLFDRFMVEEQFGWRIAEQCPDAMRILDTEDLHCLRKARQLAVKEDRMFENRDLVSEIAKREVASIYRSDLTLMISTYEMELLQRFFKVPESLLQYVPFLVDNVPSSFADFESRNHFVAIGNFLHPPNWDATLQLKQHIWPLIRKELPKAELHVYGAYPSQKVLQLHKPTEGFHIKGRAEDAKEVISNAKVMLAPLRFGAGLKGKFIDAMTCGTPSVTTAVGAEAMSKDGLWGGAIHEDVANFAKAAIGLYTSKVAWKDAQTVGAKILVDIFEKEHHIPGLRSRLNGVSKQLTTHRATNFTGQMLAHHSLRSTKYMSLWIAEKNKN